MSRDLVDRSVAEFVEAVADPEQPVPAGGSVAALTAAASAALLALISGVLRRKHPTLLVEQQERANRLRRELLSLVEEDAAAFRAFLDARRAHGDLQVAVARTSQTPLQIARACLEVIDLSQEIEVNTSGPMLADVRAARLLTAAALRTVLEIADQNLDLVQDPAEKRDLQAEISRLRARPGRSEKSR